LVFRNSDKENGRPTASQTKLNAGSESGIAWSGWGFLREFFPNVRGLLEHLSAVFVFMERVEGPVTCFRRLIKQDSYEANKYELPTTAP